MSASVNTVSNLWRQTAVTAAIACVFAAGQAQANGTDPTVVAGQASFSTQGSSLSITNSPGAIINWQGFSIGASEATNFIQQSAASSVLNRVIGSDPSVILGTLTSNGRVFLINPSGILVGQGARIDVAGLTASTLNLSNQDFLAGRLNFASNPLAGKVENQGSITTPSGGSVYLVGSAVTNSGIINSPQGDVILAAGQSVNIFDTSTPGVRVEVTASDNAAVNLGKILAQSGQVGIYGAALRNAGIINADQVVKDASGKIVLRAKQDVTLEAGSHLSANGEQGSAITVQSETGTTLVSGVIDAKGTGDAGKGGTVLVLGNHAGLVAASIDVSGAAAGGTVLVGGDLHGTNLAVQNASATYMSADSTITADAITHGRGGEIVLWANDSTRAYGSLTAHGGANSGNGGLIETSGRWLDVAGIDVSASAANGMGGTWLLDPNNIEINAAGPETIFTASPNFTSTGDTAILLNTSIQTVLNAGTSVVVTTGTGGTNLQLGDITVASTIAWDHTSGPTLTLNATNDVIVNAGATITATTGSLVLNAGRDVTVNAATKSTTGNLTFNAGRDVNVNAALTVTTGNIVLIADNNGNVPRTPGFPGITAGTVAITCGSHCLTITTGNLNIRFNPADYLATTIATDRANYLSNLTGGGGLDVKAWVFGQANNKPYDGNTTATVNSSFNDPSGILTAAGVTLSGTFAPTPTFDTKDVLTANLVTFGSNFTHADYALFAPSGSGANIGTAMANITTANLLLSGTQSYNGTTTMAGSVLTATGVNGETFTVTGTGATDLTAKDVQTNQPLANVTNLALGTSSNGGLSTNYNILSTVGSTVSVTKANLTLSGNNVTKVYDGGLTAVDTAAVTGGILFSGDTLSSGSFAFTDKNVGSGNKTVTVGGVTVNDGNSGGNYTVGYASNTTSTITPATLAVAANPHSKLYGTSDPALTYTANGFQLNDTAVSVLSGALSRAPGENVGSYAIGKNTLASNANYIVAYTGANLGITPATLNVAANAQNKVFGTSDPALTFNVTGLVNNPSLGIADTATTVLSGALTRVPGESTLGGPYAITQGSLAANSNYTLGFTPSNLIITGAAAEPVLGFNAGQVIFAGVINNEFYYRPGNFWHIALNPNNADPGFDVMRGTNDLNSRLRRSTIPCDSVFGGGFCETWSFPQQREKVDKK